jgi:hypothetical protein
MGKTSQDLKFALDNIKKNLILITDHNVQYPCPQCLKKHYAAIQAYAEEALPMTDDKDLQNYLTKIIDTSIRKRKELGDVLAE